ncbi:MAG: radical SAM protein [Sulfuritalea sp.]|jgi:MoaA/NifB/PqqE/SkfB family radical SAM enzyme|nr:radical SAM protein [Sulfuritalea sp.]
MSCNNSVDLADRNNTRERLRTEKPNVLEKFILIDQNGAKGISPPPVIELAYRYECNLVCDHCFASKFSSKKKSLSLEDVRNLSSQAHSLGISQFILQGGEPLFWPDFDEVVDAINPDNFYIGLVTNATLLDEAKIVHLRTIGIDKIVISLDSYDVAKYEKNRNKSGLFKHTINMLLAAKAAGLRVVINTVATKENVRDQALLDLVAFAKKHDFVVYVNFATPIGSWEGRYDLLLDQSDAEYIYQLNKEHGVIKRDTFPFQGEKVGCPAFRSIVYITEYGDVLPCPFLHISMGNILDEPLPAIIDRGVRVSWFKNRPALCLAAEDRTFIDQKIAKTYSRPTPVSMYEIFTKEELG